MWGNATSQTEERGNKPTPSTMMIAKYPRTAINITIRADLKKRMDFFIAWLKRYHEGEATWTQNTAMDEILDHTERWDAFLQTEEHQDRGRNIS